MKKEPRIDWNDDPTEDLDRQVVDQEEAGVEREPSGAKASPKGAKPRRGANKQAKKPSQSGAPRSGR